MTELFVIKYVKLPYMYYSNYSKETDYVKRIHDEKRYIKDSTTLFMSFVIVTIVVLGILILLIIAL